MLGRLKAGPAGSEHLWSSALYGTQSSVIRAPSFGHEDHATDAEQFLTVPQLLDAVSGAASDAVLDGCPGCSISGGEVHVWGR
jgi:hypothetical protein